MAMENVSSTLVSDLNDRSVPTIVDIEIEVKCSVTEFEYVDVDRGIFGLRSKSGSNWLIGLFRKDKTHKFVHAAHTEIVRWRPEVSGNEVMFEKRLNLNGAVGLLIGEEVMINVYDVRDEKVRAADRLGSALLNLNHIANNAALNGSLPQSSLQLSQLL